MPRRLAALWSERVLGETLARRKLAELGRRDLDRLTTQLSAWALQPTGTEGYRKAEVTSGGVATDEIDPRTLQSRRVPGLYFVGEVLDVTGWLGGYNFQWAWASGYVAGHSLGR
jgi:predicted flavoprotein YhiN